jgi:hypothetical protein
MDRAMKEKEFGECCRSNGVSVTHRVPVWNCRGGTIACATLSEFELDMAQIHAAIMKLNAETMKIQAEAKWYPFVVLVGTIGAAIGIVKLFM